jgi:ribosomal protein L6P/L9E
LEQKKHLIFSLGYSHFIKYSIQDDIEVIMFDKQQFKIFGLDLGKVRQTVSDLCNLHALDIYKGKGIYCKNHILILKQSSKSKS